MTEELARVRALFEGLLLRAATPAELRLWSGKLRETNDFFYLFSLLVSSPEYQFRHRVRSVWPAGHFYSPVVDPASVGDYVERAGKIQPTDIDGIDLDVEQMSQFWLVHQQFIRATPFTREPAQGLRYYWRDSPYPIGDAVTYRAMINALRPSRIIEVGSGFSSACALDTLDEIGMPDARLTCIEPDPAALRKRLYPADLGRVNIIESIVQEVPISAFSVLEKDDILFIDSTHVLKTGSDVHYTLFSILPSLKPGVVIHFHDIRWPFEYPWAFIFERNYSWNEAYALRAFLMYNKRFSVIFYNSLFAEHRQALARETFPDFLVNAGSSIWVRVNR
jgi:hypothetical protein